MRFRAVVVGVCLALMGSRASEATAPIFTETSLRGTRAAAAILARLAQKPPGMDAVGQATTPALGHYRAIVILLQFPADAFGPAQLADTIAHPPSAYDSLLFAVSPTAKSLHNYYREASNGLFDIDGVVTRWYTAPHSYAYYTDGISGLGLDPPRNAQQMAYDAVQLADQDLDFDLFDDNGPNGVPDGKVDGIFVVHAGPGAEETASGGDIYSHMSDLAVTYTSGDPGATQVSAYTTEAERWAGIAPHVAPNQLMSVGTFCHEFGHVLNLPDLYDTRKDPAASEGVGEWDVMGSGNFNHAPGESLGMSPAHFSAWSKQALGWITPVHQFMDGSGTVLAPVETGGPVYRLWKGGDLVEEYFLIENRQPIGFDAGLVRRSIEVDGVQAHGLVIYHVDETMDNNNTAGRKLVDIEEAGGPESVVGPVGVQNLDVHRGTTVTQSVCGTSFGVTGNRGDRYDPWPGPLGAAEFSSESCPTSASDCGPPSQVAVRNIAENGGIITADLFVRGTTVVHQGIVVDDAPRIDAPANNGDGRPVPGESVLLHVPLLNVNGQTSAPLYAKLVSLDAMTTITAGDSIVYAPIGVLQSDSGSAVTVSIHSAPDPSAAWFLYSLRSSTGLVRADTLQLLLGTSTGLCDDFESGIKRWIADPVACGNGSQWHRESGINHTPGGTWAWKAGPVGSIGSYAGGQDARLISPPFRLTGSADTLSFWQRYGTDAAADGVSLEITYDEGETWTLLHPVPDYNFGDHWSGTQTTFVQAKVPLPAGGGIAQIAFRFISGILGSGAGWWIDDVATTGDAVCAGTDADAFTFDASYRADRSAVWVSWDLGGEGVPSVRIDRAPVGGDRALLSTPTGYFGSGHLEDPTAEPGQSYLYWLTALRAGGSPLEYGPARVDVPSRAPALTLGPVHPNPFRPEARIPVTLDRDGDIVLRIFRADGTLVRTLYRGPGTAGTRMFAWNGQDDRGKRLAAGVYLIELRSGSRTQVEKGMLLR